MWRVRVRNVWRVRTVRTVVALGLVALLLLTQQGGLHREEGEEHGQTKWSPT